MPYQMQDDDKCYICGRQKNARTANIEHIKCPHCGKIFCNAHAKGLLSLKCPNCNGKIGRGDFVRY